MTLIAGPLVGCLLAFLQCWLGDVSSLDVGYTYMVFTIIGAIAGFVGAIAFAISGIGESMRKTPVGPTQHNRD